MGSGSRMIILAKNEAAASGNPTWSVCQSQTRSLPAHFCETASKFIELQWERVAHHFFKKSLELSEWTGPMAADLLEECV